MKFRLAVFIAAITVIVPGCLRSLHPLYTEKDLVFDEKLLGTWIEKEGKATWTFEKGGEKRYELVYYQRDYRREGKPEKVVSGDTARFSAHLVKLDRYYFLDIVPGKLNVKNDLLMTHLVAAHTFSRVWLGADTLRMAMFDQDWVKKMIDSKKLKIQHERLDEEQVILTAPTKAIQKLVVTYAENKAAFPGPSELVRER